MDQRRRASGLAGFSIIELMTVVAVIGIIAAVAVPATVDMVNALRLGMSVRDVERELEFARLKAVSSNSPMRVRLDCPAPGMFRAVELIGTTHLPAPQDSPASTDRCLDDQAHYPYSPTAAGRSRLTRPNNDGPIEWLQPGVSFVREPVLEFWPDGTVHSFGLLNPWPVLSAAGATISLTRNGVSKNITVNALGKIQMDR